MHGKTVKSRRRRATVRRESLQRWPLSFGENRNDSQRFRAEMGRPRRCLGFVDEIPAKTKQAAKPGDRRSFNLERHFEAGECLSGQPSTPAREGEEEK